MTTTPTETATPTETSTPTLEPTLTPKPLPLLDQFIALIMNGNASQVVGVFIGDYLGLQVVQQPSGNAGFVSTQNEVVTYFTMVKNMTGNTGLLAHNYLAGIYYYDLYPGESVVLIYGDGSTEEFIVSDNEKYQALNPTNPTSDFVSVTSGERLSSTELFFRVYGGANRTTFQTCIAQGSESSWGRLFVIALQN